MTSFIHRIVCQMAMWNPDDPFQWSANRCLGGQKNVVFFFLLKHGRFINIWPLNCFPSWFGMKKHPVCKCSSSKKLPCMLIAQWKTPLGPQYPCCQLGWCQDLSLFCSTYSVCPFGLQQTPWKEPANINTYKVRPEIAKLLYKAI